MKGKKYKLTQSANIKYGRYFRADDLVPDGPRVSDVAPSGLTFSSGSISIVDMSTMRVQPFTGR